MTTSGNNDSPFMAAAFAITEEKKRRQEAEERARALLTVIETMEKVNRDLHRENGVKIRDLEGLARFHSSKATRLEETLSRHRPRNLFERIRAAIVVLLGGAAAVPAPAEFVSSEVEKAA